MRALGRWAGRDDPPGSPPGVLGGAAELAGESSGAALAAVGRFRRPTPAGRLTWWDGVSYVVTLPARLDHLCSIGPLACGWTTWFTKYGSPTELKWSNGT